MKIPRGFIKDSEGVYRRGNFIFKNNKIFRESATIEKLKENYPTMQDCIREVLSFYSILGDEPRTTNVYIDKAGKGFKSSEKFSKNTVAVITPDRNVFEVNTTNIGDSTDFKDLVNKDKKDLPKNAKSLKTFSSDKPKDFDKLKESAEDVEKFWSQGFKIGDTIDSSGAGRVEILDLNKDADYILIKRQTGFQPFVACWAPSINEEGKLYWGQGHYFSTEEEAKEYFNSKLNESEKLNESVGDADDFRRNFSNNLTDYINKALSFKADKKQEDIEKLDDIISSFKEEIDMVNNDFIEYIKSNMNESEKLNEAYSEKLGGNPEDFISDVNEILALIKTFDTNKLATKLAYQLIEDFETKCEDLITMTKDRYLNNEGE